MNMASINMVGVMGSYAKLNEVPAHQLQFNHIYVAVAQEMQDDGQIKFVRDLCIVRQGTQKTMAGTWKCMVAFCGKSETFFLSQLPMMKFYGPIRTELSVGDEVTELKEEGETK